MKLFLSVGMRLAGLCLAASCGKPKENLVGPTWTSDVALLDALDAAVAIDRYQLRPPKDFNSVPMQQAPEDVAFVGWSSPPPGEGYGSLLGVGVKKSPPLPLKVHLNGALLDLRKGFRDWAQSESEVGSVDGIAFIRAYWSGFSKGSPVRGFLYVTHEGEHMIAIYGIMGESHYETTLPLLEASALSFRKR